MRRTTPRKLWLLGICVFPGAGVLGFGLLHSSATRAAAPTHRHEWGPGGSPGGTFRLLDERGRPVSHLLPGQVARIECFPAMDTDVCRRPDPDCCYAPGGTVLEGDGPRLVGFHDGEAGGEWGTLLGDGRFHSLTSDECWRATHYRAAGRHWGLFLFNARFDDRAVAGGPNGRSILTYDDPPSESSPLLIAIGPDPLAHDPS